MKELLSFNEQVYNNQKNSYENLIDVIQEPVSLFNSFSIGYLQPDELSRLFLDTNGLLFDKISKGENIFINGIKIDKIKALDIIEKPVGYNNLLGLIKSCVEGLRNHGYYNIQPISVQKITSIYQLTKAGEIELKKEFCEELKNLNRKFANSEVAKKMLELSKHCIKQIELLGLSEIICSNPNGPGRAFDSIVLVTKDKKLVINTDGISKYN